MRQESFLKFLEAKQMNIEYLKSQLIPKSNKLKVIYAVLWILEPAVMSLIVTYIILKNRKKKVISGEKN